MIELDTYKDYVNYIGKEIPPSEWHKVDQKQINDFADATFDHHWYHVDVERARREMPDGRTIAHGLFTLSLVPGMTEKIIHVKDKGQARNYGFDRVRFTAPVQVDSRLRLHAKVVSMEAKKIGTVVRTAYLMEIEGSARPALSTENAVMFLF